MPLLTKAILQCMRRVYLSSVALYKGTNLNFGLVLVPPGDCHGVLFLWVTWLSLTFFRLYTANIIHNWGRKFLQINKWTENNLLYAFLKYSIIIFGYLNNTWILIMTTTKFAYNLNFRHSIHMVIWNNKNQSLILTIPFTKIYNFYMVLLRQYLKKYFHLMFFTWPYVHKDFVTIIFSRS